MARTGVKKRGRFGAEHTQRDNKMLYVYVVVLFMNGNFNTYSPPILFDTIEKCEEFKMENMNRLAQTKPDFGNPDAVGMCVQLPQKT